MYQMFYHQIILKIMRYVKLNPTQSVSRRSFFATSQLPKAIKIPYNSRKVLFVKTIITPRETPSQTKAALRFLKSLIPAKLVRVE